MASELLSSPVFWLLAIPGIFLTGISKSGFAGGAGVVAVPLLALVTTPSVAVILVLPLLLLMDAQTIRHHRHNLSFVELKVIIPAALLGVVIGSYVLGGLPERPLQVLLGVMCLAFAALSFWRPSLQLSNRAGWLLGGVAGITSTLIHAGGPPLNIYLASRKLPRAIWISTAAVFFFSINLAKVFAYAAIDLWHLDLLLLALAFCPVAWLGVLAGHRIQAMISETTFVRAVMICLLASGLMLIYKAAGV